MIRRLSAVATAALLAFALLGFAPADPGPGKEHYANPPIHVRGKPTASAPTGLSPAQIRHAYGFDQLSNDGSGQIIGIVDAFDDPTAASDLQTFINQYGLASMYGLPNTPSCTVAAGPHPCFQKLYAQGRKPRTNGGWALEVSLDVQWAHAIAPGADILLVESTNNSFSSLLGAIDVAANNGASVVSMSWGGGEWSGETSYDSHFNRSGVTFTAASGDSGNGTIYPATSPYVLAVGGTTLHFDNSGSYSSETAWSGSGGGISSYEAEPGYQSSYPIPSTGGKRGVPDVAYNADPATGVSVYDSTPYSGRTGWFVVGGTSAGAPQWAALVALANQGRRSPLSSSNLASSPEYDAATGSAYASNYHDVTSGTNGNCGSLCTATTGYDFVTGLGSPRADSLVPALAKAR